MLILGDVLAIIGLLVGGALTAWALILAFTLLLPGRINVAEARLTGHPWRSFFLGLFLLAVLGTASVVMLGMALPLAKLMGTMLLLVILSIGMLGFAGLALRTSRKIQMLDSSVSPYRNLTRASAILVISCFFPFLGWFLIAPILFSIGIGAGFQSLLGTAAAPQES